MLRSCSSLAAALCGGVQQDRPSFKAQSELVVLHVTVKDRKGAYVSGLTADAFESSRKNSGSTVTFFAAGGRAGHHRPGDRQQRQHGGRFATASSRPPRRSSSRAIPDEVFALVFNDDVRPCSDPASPFTSDATRCEPALLDVFVPAGRTRSTTPSLHGLRYVAKGHRAIGGCSWC